MSRGDDAAKRSFTSGKWDWLDAVLVDPHTDAACFAVAYVIAQCVDMKTGCAFVSDEAISDRTGIRIRRIVEARAALRDWNWISWTRTRTANVYRVKSDRMATMADRQNNLRNARAKRRDERKALARDVRTSAELGVRTSADTHLSCSPEEVAKDDADRKKATTASVVGRAGPARPARLQ